MFMAFCINAKAQQFIFEDDFNDGIEEGWTLVDQDGDAKNWEFRLAASSTWQQRTAPMVLGSLTTTAGQERDNWAILPVQDLSFYNGVQLNFKYLAGIYQVQNMEDVAIYAAATPNIADMLLNGPIASLQLMRLGGSMVPTVLPLEISKTVDIPAQYYLPTVYIAIRHYNPDGISGSGRCVDLTEVNLTYASLGIDDVAGKTATIIKQNPVAETLQLQLGKTVNAESLNLQIYNMSGMLVKEAKYNEAGMSVSDLAGGMYFAVLNDGFAIERLKFIKK